jgi:hypothetical protein
VVAALAAVAALVLSVLAAVTFANAGQAAPAAQKVFVCKYVGTPGVDERLKPGENPISVSSNATVGSTFPDAQGRSYVIAVDNGQNPPQCPATPPGPIPPCPTTSEPTPDPPPPTEPTATERPEETEETSPPTEETSPTEETTAPEATSPTDESPTTGEGCDDCEESASPTGTAGPGESTEETSRTEEASPTEETATSPDEEPSETTEQPGAGVGQCDPAGAAGAEVEGPGSGQDEPEEAPDADQGLGGDRGDTDDVPTGSDAGLTTTTRVYAGSPPDLVRPGRPLGLRIPALALDSRVVPVTTADGVLQPPVDPATVGWWADGRRPGAAHGRALLTAHAVHAGSGAFDELGALDAGDRVVVRAGGDRRGFTVTRVQVLTATDLADRSARLFRQVGPPRLVLIGCTAWNGVRYTSNVVVVARPR